MLDTNVKQRYPSQGDLAPKGESEIHPFGLWFL